MLNKKRALAEQASIDVMGNVVRIMTDKDLYSMMEKLDFYWSERDGCWIDAQKEFSFARRRSIKGHDSTDFEKYW